MTIEGDSDATTPNHAVATGGDYVLDFPGDSGGDLCRHEQRPGERYVHQPAHRHVHLVDDWTVRFLPLVCRRSFRHRLVAVQEPTVPVTMSRCIGPQCATKPLGPMRHNLNNYAATYTFVTIINND